MSTQTDTQDKSACCQPIKPCCDSTCCNTECCPEGCCTSDCCQPAAQA